MIRFHVSQLGQEPISTDWQDEPVTHGPGVIPTAVVEMTKLRQQYPDAAIRIERKTVIPQPERKLFRFDIEVRDGRMLVMDKDGTRGVEVGGLTLQSRSFQEAEEEKVRAEIMESLPESRLIRREVTRG